MYKSFFALVIKCLYLTCLKISHVKVITETFWSLAVSGGGDITPGIVGVVTCICLLTILRLHPLACTLSLDRDKTALKDS